MSGKNLEQALGAFDDPIEFVRSVGPHADTNHLRLFEGIPEEFTNWREEQTAWKKSVALADLSHHMYDLRVTGADALDLFADLGANNFAGFEPGQAKQFIATNPDGYMIGDGILFYLDEDDLNLVGYSAINWVQYNLENGDYDATAERDDHSGVRNGPPATFRYQIQGPDALKVIREAIDESLPEVPFFNFRPISVGGNDVYALRHGMMDEPGFELFGDWAHAEETRGAIMEAGDEYGIRSIGGRAYPTNVIPTAWIPIPLPAIYGGGEWARDYREWLGADAFEGAMTVGGSYVPDDVSSYYLDPVEVGFERFLDFDHDFVGREAVRERVENPRRQKVTLVWDGNDTTDVFGSLFHGSDIGAEKYIDLPTPNWATSMYDAVTKEGETVGISIAPRYLYFEQRMFSLGCVDVKHAEPGTEVTLVWGEAGESTNPRVESHEQTENGATVAPAPYFEDKRKTADYTTV